MRRTRVRLIVAALAVVGAAAALTGFHENGGQAAPAGYHEGNTTTGARVVVAMPAGHIWAD